MERNLERIRLMRSPLTRYFLARPIGVWHLLLHGLAASQAPASPSGGTSPGERARWLGGDATRFDSGDAAANAASAPTPPSFDGGPMKITPWYLAALAPFAAMGCSGAYLGHAAVVVLTIGIFLGTLSLGRTTSSPPTQPPTIS